MAGLGNVLSVFILVTIGTVTFASLGLIVASVTNTMQETQIINQIIWFVFLFISGATIPFPMLPAMVQKVAVFLPATYLVSGLQRAMIDHTNLTEPRIVPGLSRRMRPDRVPRRPRNSSAGNRKPKPLAGPSSGPPPRWFLSSCWASGKTSTAICAATP